MPHDVIRLDVAVINRNLALLHIHKGIKYLVHHLINLAYWQLQVALALGIVAQVVSVKEFHKREEHPLIGLPVVHKPHDIGMSQILQCLKLVHSLGGSQLTIEDLSSVIFALGAVQSTEHAAKTAFAQFVIEHKIVVNLVARAEVFKFNLLGVVTGYNCGLLLVAKSMVGNKINYLLRITPTLLKVGGDSIFN